jgi:hypothetical protein
MVTGKPPAAFLSHSTVDRNTAYRLATDLRAAGIDVWYAEWELRAGDSLRRKIDEGIDRATHFIVLLTSASLKSEWVQTELDAGLVNRISGKCRLIPVLFGVSNEEVPATLRGVVWVPLQPYDDGLRRLIEVCHDVSRKPPLGSAPTWASARPLQSSGMSPGAQRLAALINERSEFGWKYDMFGKDDLMQALSMTPEELGMAASELEDQYWVKLHVTMGCGAARFSTLQPRMRLFFETDPALKGWDPAEDALDLATVMVNISKNDYAQLSEADAQLGWGPRRLNPAAEYLDDHGYIRALRSHGGQPYTFSTAAIDFKTRRFAESR